MPAFKTTDQMEKYIKSRLKLVLVRVRKTIYDVINGFLKQYYAEYTPKYYHRTKTFYNSLVRSNVVETPNGYEVSVYFDVDLMHHVTHHLGWDEGQILAANLAGQHGGAGTFASKPWSNSLIIFDRELIGVLKKMLIEAGLPVI